MVIALSFGELPELTVSPLVPVRMLGIGADLQLSGLTLCRTSGSSIANEEFILSIRFPPNPLKRSCCMVARGELVAGSIVLGSVIYLFEHPNFQLLDVICWTQPLDESIISGNISEAEEFGDRAELIDSIAISEPIPISD